MQPIYFLLYSTMLSVIITIIELHNTLFVLAVGEPPRKRIRVESMSTKSRYYLAKKYFYFDFFDTYHYRSRKNPCFIVFDTQSHPHPFPIHSKRPLNLKLQEIA